MENFEAVDRNLRHTMRCFAHATPESEVREMPGVLITNAGVGSPVFNAAMLTSPIAEDPVDLDRRVAIAHVYYTSKALPWSFWVCEDLAPPRMRKEIEAMLKQRGLRRSAVCPGMLASELPPAKVDLPELEIERVGSAPSRLAFCHITTVCFRIPFATSVAIYNAPQTWKTDFKAFVARIDGEAVATAATVNAGGSIGLYSVATLPEQQGRGIAEGLTRRVLQEARNGNSQQPIVLQATKQGMRLYERLGFREVTSISVYVAR